ncbi:MAG TPA: hypothetical protein VKA34_18180, partial [Balneolales bacterium]|nr:hypothetical protein [Balneolales bacterium]
MRKVISVLKTSGFLLLVVFMFSCSMNQHKSDQKTTNKNYAPGIKDNYKAIAGIKYYKQWGPHNVHDPSCIK